MSYVPPVFALLACVAWIILSGTLLKWHPLFSLLTATIGFGLITGMEPLNLLEIMTQGFGSLVGSIGLIVVLGSILGALLEDSGNVQALGKSLVTRSRRPSLALALLGMLLGIPVFCDSGFIILFSLTKSMATASQTPLPVMSLSLAGGLYSSHTLVPPTPGPVAAAGSLGISGAMGLVMLFGILVALPVTIIGHLFAQYAGRNIMVIESSRHEGTGASGSPRTALLLICFPVLLIANGSLVELLDLEGGWAKFFSIIGKPVVALLFAVGLAVGLMRKSVKIAPSTEKGLRQAGPIILLTACGGALGAVLKASALADSMKNVLSGEWLAGGEFLVAAFLISAIFKTAQGSTTSAMILVSALLAPFVEDAGLVTLTGQTLLVLAIGAGAMTVSHANDSYFWVVSQFSGFSLRDGYRGMTLMTLAQGLTALLSVLLLYSIFG